MSDESDLDAKYFIDPHVYNCPFCNRRNVSYQVAGQREFDWTAAKKCYVYFIECNSCDNVSMHLTFREFELEDIGLYTTDRFPGDIGDLDSVFFFSVPSSFFVVNSNIPRVFRELYAEAEGCLKGNFLTGASACARKIIYELALLEGATGNSYEERIKSLKLLKPEIDSAYFDTLLTIQQLTSAKVHEKAYDKWESAHLRLILASLIEVLHELYVAPRDRKARRQAILDLKKEVLEDGEGGQDDDSIDDESTKQPRGA